ncbi:MAG: universal stress protein [Pseudonocardiales bacterium]|nr:universal stress protein [Pseudonocardiales bacterium]
MTRRLVVSESRPAVVVGVDGSLSSRDALRWAVRQAALLGGEVHAVTAWRSQAPYGHAPVDSDVDFATQAGKMLEEVVAETLRQREPAKVAELVGKQLAEVVAETLGATPPVPVLERVVEGHPAEVLVEASREAELLVVGSHGHGAFTGMLLGSVSQHSVQHATCPVVVIRGESPSDTSGRRSRG